jgi:hypothetical protein
VLPQNSGPVSTSTDTDPRKAPADAHPEIGTFDHLEAFIGQRGTGKSTFECQRALELATEANGAYVIGHSLGARLPERLPDGTVLPITYHRSIDRLERALRSKPERWHILAPAPGGGDTADDVLRLSLRLSDAIKLRAYEQAHPLGGLFRDKHSLKYTGLPCPPIVEIVDEGIAVEAAGKQGDPAQRRWFLEYLYSLRHNHIGLLWSIQDANARSWQILAQATLLHVFHQKHQWARNALKAAGASDEEMTRIEALKKYEHVTVEISAPASADELEAAAAKPG